MKESIGALWEKTSQKGTAFMSGVITVPEGARAGDRIEVVVFANDKGDNPKRPDHRIYQGEQRTHGANESSSEVPF